MDSHCAGPRLQRHLLKADPTAYEPREGIQPRWSGLRVQGTATSPSSTANIIILSKPKKSKPY